MKSKLAILALSLLSSSALGADVNIYVGSGQASSGFVINSPVGTCNICVPLPISGTFTATNDSVGPTGSAVPADATYIGMTVAGTLTGLVGTSNGLKVDGSAVTQPVQLVAGTALAGKVGIDQTTPASTNGVNIVPSAIAGVGISGNAGVGVSNLVLKNAAGNFYDVEMTAGSVNLWLMIFNAASLPSDGATTAGPPSGAGNLVHCIPIPANTVNGISYSEIPEVFSTGITIAASSTACPTLTASATAFIHGRAK
jgi:hypothetical protein